MLHTITKDMLATALQRLEAIQGNETTTLESEQLRQRAEEVAEVALQAIAICVKHMMGSQGESTIEGIGTLFLQDGQIRFTPERDLLQYALLKHQDEVSLQQALREAFIKNLGLARGILPMIGLAHDAQIDGPLELAAEERLLKAIFGETTSIRFDVAASSLLSAIIQDLHSAGVTVKLTSDVPMTASEEDRARRRAELFKMSHAGDIEIGRNYLGKVVRVGDFGAFVELRPGIDGLLHISDISEQRVRDVRDELKLDDQVLVKVLHIEGNKIRLSRKAVLREQREAKTMSTNQEERET